MNTQARTTHGWLEGLALPTASAPAIKSFAEDEADWTHLLLRNRNGNPTACVQNALVALRFCPEWKGVLHFDESAFTS
jgi:hypothetical protein